MYDDWDPWKRYIRHQERLQWDSWYRYEYERERQQWDPFYRYMKEVQRKQWDSEYRWQKYEEDKYSSRWYERYLENPADPILRQRYEMLYGRRDRGQVFKPRTGGTSPASSIVDTASRSATSTAASMASSMAASFADLVALAYGIAEQRASAYDIIPPWKLPSMTRIIIKNALNIGLIAFFAIMNLLGYVNHPIMVALIMVFLAIFLRSLPMIITTITLLFLTPQAVGETLSLMTTELPLAEYTKLVASIYARTFIYTLPIAVIASAISIVWNRKRNREMRERWRNLVNDVMEELIEKYKKESQSDAGEKKEPPTPADFFNSLEAQSEEGNANSREKDKKGYDIYDVPNLSTFFDSLGSKQ
ncbi:hypothetical protein Igag_1963 [Ignisphaera aggregans DSM 17230]|uniref:Uncharacterized protein n=1 Tax=Ignisphaera aggregans (strain DSM 17230 / JCM 13409 / AQ1.S1) TaxID=583356 RepID=E0STG9_IGNAA|nr:hypothetical protein Igag_1963 [Ignisphaera aggregans DSM 17230]